MQLTFDDIEKLKRDYTDKLVAVDAERPELKRFVGQTGRVRTVNMSGRALVEFDAYNNIGWYDIDLDSLRVIDQPLPKLAEGESHAKKAPAKEAAPKKAAEPAEKKAAEKPAAAAKPAGKSTADILAAARAGQGGAAAAPVAKEKPAAAGGKKPSTAEILAAARAAKQSAPTEEPAPVAEGSTADAEITEMEAEEAAAVVADKPAKVAGGKPAGPLPTTTAGKIAWCRTADAK